MNPLDLMAGAARFWALVDRTADCWLWTGRQNSQGYGRFEVSENGRRYRPLAHRMAYQLAGGNLTAEDNLLHSCDTPLCVNPAHLSPGTQAANMQDAKAKGRTDTTGLTADVPHCCKECGAPFIGAPNRRYCDEHRYYPNRRRDLARARRRLERIDGAA